MSNAKQQQDDEVEETVTGVENEAEEFKEDTAEDRAKRMGWRPKEEYKGAEDKWVSAEEFVRRADEDPREVRKANHVLMRKVQKLERGIDDILAHQTRQLEETRQQAYAAAHADLKRAHAQAVQDGDTEKADRVWQARESLAQRQVEEARAVPEKTVDNDEATIVSAWTEENSSWYGKNYKATKEANEYEDWLARRGVPLADRLRQTAEYIKTEVLGEKPRQREGAPAAVNGHNNNGTVRSGRKAQPGTYEALTAAARAECDRTVRTSGGKVTKAMWLSFATPEMFQQ